MTTSRRRLTPDQLTQVRQNTNWRQLFAALHIEKDIRRSHDHDWWGKSPFRPDEHTASFHMNGRGWYCHSTGQGGGPIELVQRLHSGMSCYDAAQWLLEHGVSRIVTATRDEVENLGTESRETTEPTPENPPIRHDLRKQLDPDHPAFAKRDIPPAVLRELGAGYLERTRKSKRRDAMNQRLVFQVRGLRRSDAGEFQPVILGHIGRATTEEQEERDGKWWTYRGFRKSLELYNLDRVVLEEAARQQIRETGSVVVVEGCFDVAKLRAAGILNAVAAFGSRLSPQQVERLQEITEVAKADYCRLFFDRDEAGKKGAQEALAALSVASLRGNIFNWEQAWSSDRRTGIAIPSTISDPADFSVKQLQWLRNEGLI